MREARTLPGLAKGSQTGAEDPQEPVSPPATRTQEPGRHALSKRPRLAQLSPRSQSDNPSPFLHPHGENQNAPRDAQIIVPMAQDRLPTPSMLADQGRTLIGELIFSWPRFGFGGAVVQCCRGAQAGVVGFGMDCGRSGRSFCDDPVLIGAARAHGPSAAPGHPPVLTGKEQERLHAEVEALLASGRITVRAPGGGELAA